MKPYCIPVDCPSCGAHIKQDRFSDPFCSECNGLDIHSGYRPEDFNINYIYIRCNDIEIFIYLFRGKEKTNIYRFGKFISHHPYAIWFDLTSQEEILRKVKLLLTYS